MKINLCVIFFLLTNTVIYGQSITGTVVDEHDQIIQEANILNVNTDQHTHSNELGAFTLENCTIGDTLQVSFVGYQTAWLTIKNLDEPLNIVLNEKAINIEELVISPKIDALHIITDIDIQTNPVNSSQDIMRKIPGLFIGQHAGGGKAEQLFLRGFDIDHGTDINVSVDGLPVNMVSHAHGQGYADLHFVIPETVEKINFGKGPYYEDRGDFTTAGYVAFSTKEDLDNSAIKLEAGQFNTYRLLGMFDLLENKKQAAYIATEFLSTDGYFDSPQNFNRINLFGKYSGKTSKNNKIDVVASYFDSKWDASGQVPKRAVDSGLISRFGAIDDTEGGATSRSNLSVDYKYAIGKDATLKSQVYLSQYAFDLFSNFTFYLEDSINGDQIRQKENRMIYGLTTDYMKTFSKGRLEGTWQAGITLRNDQTKNSALTHTKNRVEPLAALQLGDIDQTNVGAYMGTTIEVNKWTFNPSVRLDYFNFQYNDKLAASYKTQEENKAIVSPKCNILYNPNYDLQFYLKAGKGFHSNDTRVVVAEEGKKIVPSAYGADIGYIWKIRPKMLVNMAYWYLFLEQEFVYVGDAGIVEPSGRTQRQGFDLSYRYQPLSWLFWNIDTNYTYARSLDEERGQDYIPLAPDFTLVSGLNFLFPSGLYGSTNIRHLANRPANEDNSIIAKGYTVADVNAGYKWRKMSLGFQIQNLFNTEWNETQFATTSRLQDEDLAIEEIHFTPGTPFFIKGLLQYNF